MSKLRKCNRSCLPVAQRSSERFSNRIEKVTLSKTPVVIILQGSFRKLGTASEVKKKGPLQFQELHSIIILKDEAAKCFASGLYFLESDQIYGSSPDRTFLGETCKTIVEIKTGK